MSKLIPLFPLDLVLFPGMILPLHIFEPRYKEMIGEALANSSTFGIVRAVEDGIAQIGCSAEVVTVVKRYEDGKLDIVTRGLDRFRVLEVNRDRSFLQAEVEFLPDETEAAPELRKKAIDLHRSLILLLSTGAAIPVNLDAPAEQLSFWLIAQLPVDLGFKQAILVTPTESQRLSTLVEYYEAVIPTIGRTMQAKKKSGGNGHVM
ncbi:MAG TPA: LON peptidase substrate-binding domain-containing protein [Terriglobales bacterium]|nr:LON peptidase substrate-binding domain-containing protein [Terriglobales bacterium]